MIPMVLWNFVNIGPGNDLFGHYLNQCWIIFKWTIKNTLQLNFVYNSDIFIEKCIRKCGLPNGIHFLQASFFFQWILYFNVSVFRI